MPAPAPGRIHSAPRLVLLALLASGPGALAAPPPASSSGTATAVAPPSGNAAAAATPGASTPASTPGATVLSETAAITGELSQRPHLTLQPGTARPGDPVLVTVQGLAAMPTGTLGDRPLRFFPWQDGYVAITGLPVELAPGPAALRVSGPTTPGGAPVELTGTLDVVPPGFRERTLSVAGKYVEPPKEVKARMEADRRAFAIAFSQPLVPFLFGQNFAWPRAASITAPFGDRRSFNGKLQTQHFGMDLDGATGAPILAANDGVVVMARDNFASGNTVIVHHGGGLYTTYFHMSRIGVKQGAKVKQGQRLGLVGKTGRVTGPHLHWGVKVDDRWVDGATLLKLELFPRPPESSEVARSSSALGAP